MFRWVLGSQAALLHLPQHHFTSSHLLRGSKSCHTPTRGLLQSVRAPGTLTQLPWREVSGGDASSSQTRSLPTRHQQSTRLHQENRAEVPCQLPEMLPAGLCPPTSPNLSQRSSSVPHHPRLPWWVLPLQVEGSSSRASLLAVHPTCSLGARGNTQTQSRAKVSLQIETRLLLAWLGAETEHDDGSRFEENHKEGTVL